MTDMQTAIAKLQGVHPRLIAAITHIIYAFHELGLDLRVTDGVRTVAQQQALFAQGRTAPGAIVTNCDGVTKRSNHQPHADGYGHAVDCAFFLDGKPSWDEKLPWALYGEAVEQQGLRWGGRWSSPVDRPHAELPDGVA